MIARLCDGNSRQESRPDLRALLTGWQLRRDPRRGCRCGISSSGNGSGSRVAMSCDLEEGAIYGVGHACSGAAPVSSGLRHPANAIYLRRTGAGVASSCSTAIARLPTLTVVPAVSACARHFQVVETAESVSRCAKPASCQPAVFGASRLTSARLPPSLATLR